jgi:[protein-PII] uridylyltransferase
LHRVAAALESSGVDVQWARAATLGSSVVDSFCLVGGGENGRLRPDQRQRVERAVLTAAG